MQEAGYKGEVVDQRERGRRETEHKEGGTKLYGKSEDREGRKGCREK